MSSTTTTTATTSLTKLEPADVSIVRITEHDDPRVAQACEVLRQGFQNDPTMLCMVGGKDALRLRMHNAVVQASIIGGELWVAIANRDYEGCHGLELGEGESKSKSEFVKKGDVVGAASWYPSGTDFLDDDAQFQAGFAQLFAELERTEPELHKWWFTVLFPKYESITSKLLAPLSPTYDPSLASTSDSESYQQHLAEAGKAFKKLNYSLISFAVIPSLQLRGIGKQLLEVGESKAREVSGGGVGCCLETESDEQVAMYEHLGYKLLGSEFIEGPGDTPGFTEYVMLKTF